MLTRLTSVILLLMTFPLRAEIGGPSGYDGFFFLDFYRSAGTTRRVTVDYNGETMADNVAIPGSGFHVETFSRSMKPGIKYPLTVTRAADVRYGIGVIAPDGYIAEIDGELRNAFYVDTTVADTVSYQVALRSLAASDPKNVMEVGESSGLRIGDIGWEVGLGRMSNGLGAGFVQLVAKELTPEAFTRTGLGVHLPPHNSGEIDAIYEDLNSDLVFETIRQIRSAQCLVDFVDTASSGGAVTAYDIRFYRAGTFDSGTGRYVPNGSPLVTYSVAKAGTTSLSITRADAWGTITNTASSTPDGALRDWNLSVTGGSYEKTTSINSSPITGGRREDIEVRYTANPGGLPAAATKTFRTRREFKNIAPSGNIAINEKLVSQAYNVGVSGQERTERFAYWDTPTDADYGLLKWREGVFGDWNLYGYEDIFYTGTGQTFIHDFVQWSKTNRVNGAVSALIPRQRALIFDYSPENDALNFVMGTTTVSNVVTAQSAGNVRQKNLELGYGWDELRARTISSNESLRVSGTAKYISRRFGSPLTFPLDYNSNGTNNNFIELERLYNTPNVSAFNGSDDRAIHWMAKYVPSGYATGFDKRLAFKPYMTVSPDDVKKVHGYAKVSSYEGISDAWVEVDIVGTQASEIIDNTTNRILSVTSAATGNTFNGNFAKPFLYEMGGRLVDSLSYPGALRNSVYADAITRYVAPGNVSHGGVTMRMDALQLVPGKSVKAVRALNAAGELAREERWAYDSSGSWKLAETLIYGRDSFGRVTSITRHDGASSVQRVMYEAGYTGLMLDWEKDQAGTKTDYSYDGLGRIASKTVSASHGLTSVPAAIATSSKLDAMGRVVELTTGDLTESAEYDTQGLLLSSTDVNGLTTTFTYSRESGAGMRVDTLHPGGGTETRIYHRTGRLKSVSGTSVVAANYSYSYDHGTNGTGNVQTRVDAVLTSDNATRHPWARVWTDWTGRVTRGEHSTPVTQNFSRSFSYNSITNRLDEAIETEVSANGGSVTQTLSKKFGYDEFGFGTVAGIDVDGSGLANNSTDRLARSATSFITIGGHLFQETTTTLFPENGSATGVTVTSRSRINGLASGFLSETTATDIHGNTVTATVSLDRSTATVTASTSYDDATSETSVSVMGFATSSTSRQGRASSVSYDGSGRSWLEATATGERSFATKTEFESGKARVWKITTGLAADGSGIGYPTTYGYDSAGRVSSVLDPNGGTAFYAYNNRDQLVKSWGSAVTPIWYEYDSDYGTLSKQHTWPVMQGSAPDFAGASSPPAGSSVVQFVRDNASGAVTTRTDAFGTASARVTDYTHDVLGQLRTTQTPSSIAAANSVATSRITITRQYDPKTRELTSISYSGSAASPLAFTWHRSGELKSVTENGTFVRNFNHDHSGNGATALRELSEDLPSYYSTIPALASNDSAHSANRVARSYTSSGIRGMTAGSSSGVSAGGLSGLSATRTAMTFAWAGGLIDGGSFEGATLDYGYESGSAMPNRRSVAQFEETRGFEPNRDLLSWIRTNGGGTTRARFDYVHDALGRRDTARQSGTVFGLYGDGLFADFGYDTRSRLTAQNVHAGASSGAPALPGRSFGYDYDLADNRRVATRADAPSGATSFNWSVNALNEITTRETPQWSEFSGFAPAYRGIALLPPPGTTAVEPNRTKDHFHAYHTTPAGSDVRIGNLEVLFAERGAGGADTVNPPHLKDLLDRRTINFPLRPPTETLKYDGRGNLANDAWWTYTWDGADRLIAVESSPAAISAGFEKVKLTFKYDWMGRRYAKQSHPWSGSAFAANPDKVTLFWWDGWNLLREATYNVTTWSGSNPTAASFVSETRYHWGLDISGTPGGAGGVGGLVGLATRLAGQAVSDPLFPAYDGNGNVTALLDATGKEQAAYEYDPYGKLLRASGPAADLNPFRFATKYYDRETKLLYHNERYYSPELGRFLGLDPIREGGGPNLHAYTLNNPANSVDVLGRFTTSLSWGGASGGGFSYGGFDTTFGGYGTSISFSTNLNAYDSSWWQQSSQVEQQRWALIVADMQQAAAEKQQLELQKIYNQALETFNPIAVAGAKGTLLHFPDPDSYLFYREARNFEDAHNPMIDFMPRRFEPGFVSYLDAAYEAGGERGVRDAAIPFQVLVGFAQVGVDMSPVGALMTLAHAEDQYTQGNALAGTGLLALAALDIATTGPQRAPGAHSPNLGSSLDMQENLTKIVNQQGRVVDRYLATSRNYWPTVYRAVKGAAPNFAKGIRGRVLDTRMNQIFEGGFRNIPGVHINETINGFGPLRPDLYLPNMDGRSVIFDVGSPSKINTIFKYQHMADDVIPLIPAHWIQIK
jgi:RHS repeat-associated protein